jgi:hypothetical protein
VKSREVLVPAVITESIITANAMSENVRMTGEL